MLIADSSLLMIYKGDVFSRAVVLKMCSADPKGFATRSQVIVDAFL
jgi:hypothetical protein